MKTRTTKPTCSTSTGLSSPLSAHFPSPISSSLFSRFPEWKSCSEGNTTMVSILFLSHSWLKVLLDCRFSSLCRSYFVSFISELIIILIYFLVGIQYCMIGLFPSWSAFWAMYLTCIMIALSATGTFYFILCSYHYLPGYGYMISALAPTIEAANAIAPPLMVPLLLFGGFFLQSDSVPPWFIWLKYISWFYYGAENLYVAQWREGGYCMEISNPIQVRKIAHELR